MSLVIVPTAGQVPTGIIIPMANIAATAPTGYLLCDGALVSRVTEVDLFNIIGEAFGAGDGATTFALPNLLDQFIRGADEGRGIDVGRVFGSSQLDGTAAPVAVSSVGINASTHTHVVTLPALTASHYHHMAAGTGGTHVPLYGYDNTGALAPRYTHVLRSGTTTTGASTNTNSTNHVHTVTIGTVAGHVHTASTGGDIETRPRNLQMRMFIKS